MQARMSSCSPRRHGQAGTNRQANGRAQRRRAPGAACVGTQGARIPCGSHKLYRILNGILMGSWPFN